MRLAIALTLLAAAALYALRRGGAPERQVAAILVAIQLLDMTYHHVLGLESRYGNVDAFHAFNDGWALVALLAVALRADRFWPLWIAALQIIATFSHFVRLMDLSVPPIAYAVMIRVPLWLQIFVLALGTWNRARRHSGRAGSATLPPF